MASFTINELPGLKSITCHVCDRTSYHPEDVRNRYCGACHIFHVQVTELAPGVFGYHGEMHLNLGTMLKASGFEDTPRARALLERSARTMFERRGITVETDERSD